MVDTESEVKGDFVNYCVEYRIIFYCAFIVDLIIKPFFFVYVEPFKGVHHTSFYSYT